MGTKKNLYWILALVFLVAAIIDYIDGAVPKLISSGALTLGFLLLALGQMVGRHNILNKLASLFILVALAAFAYRVLNYYMAF